MSSEERAELQRLLDKLRQGTLWVLLIQVGTVVLKYGEQVLLARFLSQENYGLFVSFRSVALICAAFAGVGLDRSVVAFVPRYEEGGHHSLLKGLSISALLTTVVAADVVGVLFFAGASVKGSVFGHTDASTFVLAAWLIPALAFLNLAAGIGRGVKSVAHAKFPMNVAVPGVTILAFVSAVQLFGVPADLYTALACALVSVVGVSLVQWILLWPRTGTAAPVFRASSWLRESLPFLQHRGISMLQNRIDVVVIAAFVGPVEAGVYNVAARTAALVSFISSSVNTLFAPMVSGLYADGKTARLQHLLATAVHWCFWPSLMACVGLFFLGDVALSLFGSSYRAGSGLLQVFVVGYLIAAAAGPLQSIMNMTGYQQKSANITTVMALFKIGTTVLFTWQFGVVGAAVAHLLATVLTKVLRYLAIRRDLGLRPAIFDNIPLPAAP